MSDEEIRYVSDPTQPNAGRIYDYILGGSYNYEVDRKVADELLKKIPSIRSGMKIVRWFLGNAVDRAFKMGFTQFLDFASGLPTVDHIHTRIPDNVKEQTKIIYSDIDPITVHLGRERLEEEGMSSNAKFLECDCRKPKALLASDTVKDLFDINQKIAIGLSGILYFLSDENIKYTVKVLYDWAPKGSIIYFCDFDIEGLKEHPAMETNLQYYKEMKQPIFMRSQKSLKNLIKPWKIKEPGLQTLEKWLDIVSLNVSEDFMEETGVTMYGGFLEK